jgi:hypothetical protein
VKKRRLRIKLDAVYVFPDGTQVTWSESLFRVCVNPAKGHGLVAAHGSFGGMTVIVSWPKDDNGNPAVDAFTQRQG